MFKATVMGKRLEEVPGLAHAGIRSTLSSLKGTAIETGIWQDPATGKEMLSVTIRKGPAQVVHLFSGPPEEILVQGIETPASKKEEKEKLLTAAGKKRDERKAS